MPKAIVFQMSGYTRAHTRECLVFIGEVYPEPVPLVLHGKSYPVGTQFKRLGGHKTSAGFEDLTFHEPIVYCGLFEEDGKSVALFKQDQLMKNEFFGWNVDADGNFFWGTDARAGRVIENTIVEVAA